MFKNHMRIVVDQISQESVKKNNRIYFPELDGLRFFAFLLVFIHHTKWFFTISQLRFLNEFGWAGVDLFFALSAFLFTKLLLVERGVSGGISFSKFYLRRVFRIWPIYYLYIIAILIVIILQKGHVALTGVNGLRLLGLLTFTDNIFCAVSGYNSIPALPHLWTIGYEEQFYIFIPLLISMLSGWSVSRRMQLLGAVSLLFFLLRAMMIVNQVPHPAIWVLPVTHFESIVLGMVIGFGGFDALARKVPPILLFIIGVACFKIMTLLPNINIISFWLFASYGLVGLSTALVLQSTIVSSTMKRFLSRKPFVYLGKRSYGLYLYHIFAILLVSKLEVYLPKLLFPDAFIFLLALLLTIVMAVVSYRVIERPFLKLKKRFEVVESRPV